MPKRQKIGIHLNGTHGMDLVHAFGGAVNLVLEETAGINSALQLADTYPDMLIVYRRWMTGVGQSDWGEAYIDRYGTNPLPVVDDHQGVINLIAGRKNIAVQFFNETCHGKDYWPRFMELNANIVREMDRRGCSASLLGTGPGHPAGEMEDIHWYWHQARPLFQAINDAKLQHYLNCHNYHVPGWNSNDPWAVRRHEWLLAEADEMELGDRILVFAGESGPADEGAMNMPGKDPNCNSNGTTYALCRLGAEAAAKELADLSLAAWEPNSRFLGSCVFCASAAFSGWEGYDLSRGENKPFVDALLPYLRRNLDMSDYNVTPTDIIIMRVVADPSLRVRVAPSVSTAVLRSIPLGATAETNGYIINEGYRWRRLTDGAFCAEINMATNDILLEEPVVPSWKQSAKIYINDVRDALDQIRTQVDDAANRLDWIENLIEEN